MVQYFINTSAIWLISLVLFDMLLKRENYHGYNRFYLMFTFLLGIALPLPQLIGNPNAPLNAYIPQGTKWLQWATIVYLAGVLIMLSLLIIDITKLII